MPTKQGPGQRRYECEDCGRKWYVPRDGFSLEAACEECGGLAYCKPFPGPEFRRRLDALCARLLEEDGPV